MVCIHLCSKENILPLAIVENVNKATHTHTHTSAHVKVACNEATHWSDDN